MCQRVGRAHGNDAQRHPGPGYGLNDVVHGAVAPTGKHSVASVGDCLPCLLGSVDAGLCEGKAGFHSGASQNRHGGPQDGVAPGAPTTGARIVEQSRFPHAGESQRVPHSHAPNVDFRGRGWHTWRANMTMRPR